MVVWFFVLCFCCLIYACFRPYRASTGLFFCRVLRHTVLPVLGVRLEIRNGEAWGKGNPRIFVANHQSTLDFFFLGGAVPDRTITILKRGLRFIPLFGGLTLLSGSLFIHRHSPKKAARALEKARQALDSGLSLVIFPEGTRSLGNELGRFHRGAFHLATRTKLAVVPIAISSYYRRLDFGRWRSGTVVIEALPELRISQIGSDRLAESLLSERTRHAIGEAIGRLDRELESGVGRSAAAARGWGRGGDLL